MVGFVPNCENISVLSFLCNREKFSAQTTGLLFRNNHKMPRKKMKTATFRFYLKWKNGISAGPNSCLKFRIPCIYIFICEESPSNKFSRSSCRTCSRISSSRFFAFRRLVKDSRLNSSQRGNCRGSSI